jgi:hypothetical protein
MEELLDLSDDLLKKVVPKIGPWNKLCKARRSLMQEANPPSALFKETDKLTDFLTELGMEQYVEVFKGNT